MIDTILFDLDDTLIVEWKSAEESFIDTIGLIDNNIDPDEFVKIIREQARELWYKLPTIDYCLKVGISSYEALWADFSGENENIKQLNALVDKYRFEAWNNALSIFNIKNPEISHRLSNEFKRIRNTRHELFPETLDVLNVLKPNYKLGLVTNGTPDLQWKKINGGNLRHFFNFIAISGDYGYGKPDERLFNAAIIGMESEKSNTIMVGDRLKTDIAGALQTGLKTIWINRNGFDRHDDIKPDFELQNLSDIEKILSAGIYA
jgi:putative hydrolase of the HAD superfamily